MNQNDRVRIVRWTDADVANNRRDWQQVLAASDADALFLSWDWQTLWWQLFGVPRGRQLLFLAAYRAGNLVGIAPFYRARNLRKGMVPVSSIQLTGMAWRDPDDLISEYLDIVAAPHDYVEVRLAFLEFLEANHRSSELVVCCADRRRGWHEVLNERSRSAASVVREVDHSVSYQADLSSGFPDYLHSLGPSTRRSLWNLRRRMTKHGQVMLEDATSKQIDAAFDDLNTLHATRWGEAVFSGRRLQFHRSFAAGAAQRGQLILSRLRSGDRVVSVLYDIRIGRRQYNLQMGFDSGFDRSISLGLIHLGYAMEAATQAGVTTYDFLAGIGQSTNYKKHLSQFARKVSTVQYVRGPILSRLYRWHERQNKA